MGYCEFFCMNLCWLEQYITCFSWFFDSFCQIILHSFHIFFCSLLFEHIYDSMLLLTITLLFLFLSSFFYVAHSIDESRTTLHIYIYITVGIIFLLFVTTVICKTPPPPLFFYNRFVCALVALVRFFLLKNWNQLVQIKY